MLLYIIVGGWTNPVWKICSSNWTFSPSRGKIRKKWNHHPGIFVYNYLLCTCFVSSSGGNITVSFLDDSQLSNSFGPMTSNSPLGFSRQPEAKTSHLAGDPHRHMDSCWMDETKICIANTYIYIYIHTCWIHTCWTKMPYKPNETSF